jgi:hypothetical protein
MKLWVKIRLCNLFFIEFLQSFLVYKVTKTERRKENFLENSLNPLEALKSLLLGDKRLSKDIRRQVENALPFFLFYRSVLFFLP